DSVVKAGDSGPGHCHRINSANGGLLFLNSNCLYSLWILLTAAWVCVCVCVYSLLILLTAVCVCVCVCVCSLLRLLCVVCVCECVSVCECVCVCVCVCV